MAKSAFVYVVYIRTAPVKLWRALTSPESQRQYWAGMTAQSDWKPGSLWKMVFPDGRVADTGKIIESRRPKRIVLKWRNEFRPALKAEGFSLCTIELEPKPGAVKLTLTHSMGRPKSKFIDAVSVGWPYVLSNLKSLLETRKVVLKDLHA